MPEVSKERLMDAFGELIYALALADGVIQPEEISALENILKGHGWGREIRWSFDYEMKKGNSLKDAYEKAMETFKNYGPAPEYQYLIEILDAVAEAADGTLEEEDTVIKGFQAELRQKILDDLEKNELKTW
jgi:tellurite resistance protein